MVGKKQMFQTVVKLETWPSCSSDLFMIKCMFILKHFSILAFEVELYLAVYEKQRCMANAWGVYDLWLNLETLRTSFVSSLAIVVVSKFSTVIFCVVYMLI
jgi:hypothetical protein